MATSRRAKSFAALAVVLVIAAYLVVVDVGISAGRIHEGVTVGGIDVGGLTQLEAAEVLRARAEELASAPVEFTTEFLNPALDPREDLGWRAFPDQMAAAAMRVGREDAPLGAVAERLDAWFGGTELEWIAKSRHRKVTSWIDEWEVEAEALGIEINRWRLRQRIRTAILTWPRRIFQLPVRTE